MRRKGITRVLLVGLLLVTGLLLIRLLQGSSNGDALVLFDRDFEVDQLVQASFVVHDHPVKVEILATGSLQSDTVLAAYPWIVREGDNAAVWILDPTRSTRGQGMTVTATEIVTLDPGRYEAYFTSFGDPLRPGTPPISFFDKISAAIDSDFQRWRTEAGRWEFSLRSLAEEDRPLIVLDPMTDDFDRSSNQVWSSGPVGNNSVSEYLFETGKPLDINVGCLGESYGKSLDAGWIEDIESGEHVWDMTTAKTEPAGGSIRNRYCNQKLALPRGRFRAVFQSDEEHAYEDWIANPPLNPSAWGMTISVFDSADVAAISAFDPWESLPRVASLTGIGDDQLVSYTFTLNEPMRVMVFTLGEGYPSRGAMFDYSWIVGAGDKEVWKMTIDQTKHAGGSSKNRRAETVLDLEAGVPYTVYFKTDETHAYGDWNEDPPPKPEQWGVTIFALDPDFVPSVDFPVVPAVPQVPVAGYSAVGGEPLVSLQSIGNGKNVSQRFVLPDTSSVQVYALGEMTRDGRYDWGWITNLGTGAVIWEMRRENSVSAGGTSKNRLVDAVIELPPGEYEAHYATDDTHAYPDFKYGGAPDNPSAWGITVRLVEKGRQQK